MHAGARRADRRRLRTRRKPAQSSNALSGPKRGTFLRCGGGSEKRPFASRKATICVGEASRPRPTRARAEAREAVLTIDADRVDRNPRRRRRAIALSFRVGSTIMLVLADADRFRVDFYEFGQWVLQTARDRHGAAQRHVHVPAALRLTRKQTPNRPRRRLPTPSRA